MSQRTQQLRQRQQRRDQLRTIAMVAAALVVGAVVVAVATQLGSDGDGGGTTASGEAAVVVSMTEFAFDPDPIVLTAEDPTLEVVNDGAAAHDLVIPDLGKGTPDLPAGERMVLDLTGQPPGSYRVVCDLPGHTEAGMVTELTIG